MSVDTGRYIIKVGPYDFRVTGAVQAFDFLDMVEEGMGKDAFDKWYVNCISFECQEMAEMFAFDHEKYEPTEYGVHYLGDYTQYNWRKQ